MGGRGCTEGYPQLCTAPNANTQVNFVSLPHLRIGATHTLLGRDSISNTKAFRQSSITDSEPRCCRTAILQRKCVAAKVVSRQPNHLSTSCCHVATSLYYTDHFKPRAEAVPNRKPRSERHGWETSFKQALLLRAEGGIRAFFDGYCRGDTASGVRGAAIAMFTAILDTIPSSHTSLSRRSTHS